MTDLSIRPLHAEDAETLAALFAAEPPDYLAHFHPFTFAAGPIRERITAAIHDRYWALIVDEELTGIFMLRGFDAGYTRPSFGVYVASRHAARGLARLALQFSLAWCRLNSVESVMLKVHPQNSAARRVYIDAGFISEGLCPNTGHEMFQWKSRRAR
ncbi:MAG: GNAT family N-acetyltransferase [Chthoniobacteraceae bacterium]